MPVIRKHILLIHAVVRAVPVKRISIRILIRQNPIDPDVLRERIQLMQAEERNAARDFMADAIEGSQLPDGFITGTIPQALRAEVSMQGSMRSSLNVLPPIPKPARFQVLLA